ncbi:MAG: hypothetical protein R3255_03485 [Candidatus Lokiarchaeia archaeon]|nr:hypothetical protein [Candidatus Lokiarchaeia archaeon]
MVINDAKDNGEVVMGDLEDFKINNIPKSKAKKSIITISTYSYGSKGLQWHYFSKLIKKK